MAKKYIGEFPPSAQGEQFGTDITHGRRRLPFGDELRHALRVEGEVVGDNVLVVPGLAGLATAMGLKELDIVEAGKRIGADSYLEILSHATGYPVREVSGFAIELDEGAGPVVQTKPNVDLSDREARSDLANRIVGENNPRDVLSLLGELASTLAQAMPKE